MAAARGTRATRRASAGSRRPVVSVGNLRVGGSGKTPIVAYIARLLLERGERPAILTRGYGRRVPRDGVTVVSDGRGVLADLETAGDEPLMLARALPGVPRAGRRRSLSVRPAGRAPARRDRPPAGRRVSASRSWRVTSTCCCVGEDDLQDRAAARRPAARAARRRGGRRRRADHRRLRHGRRADRPRVRRRAGVSRDARDRGAARCRRTRAIRWSCRADARVRGRRHRAARALLRRHRVGRLGDRRHDRVPRSPSVHGARRRARSPRAAAATGATLVLTTEKDAVRLAACDLGDLPIASVPLVVGIEPAVVRAWLLERLRRASESVDRRSHPQSDESAQSAINPQSAIRNPQSTMRHRSSTCSCAC